VLEDLIGMLSEVVYLAIALYYKKQNPTLGLTILKERWAKNQIPEDFWDWFPTIENKLIQQINAFAAKGIQFTVPGSWDYPQAFIHNLDTPPLFLTYIGNPAWTQKASLGVVGSRKLSLLTKEWMETELLGFLKNQKICVISGGARGVDQLAHLCALRARCPTYVFLPSGLECIYPKDMADWKENILSLGGAYLSEYWPTEMIKKHYFIERNRLIAAMADFVLIVQGERKSGTLLTAQWALDLGRDIGVLPGHPMDPLFSGNLELLRSGVPVVMDAQDLQSALLS